MLRNVITQRAGRASPRHASLLRISRALFMENIAHKYPRGSAIIEQRGEIARHVLPLVEHRRARRASARHRKHLVGTHLGGIARIAPRRRRQRAWRGMGRLDLVGWIQWGQRTPHYHTTGSQDYNGLEVDSSVHACHPAVHLALPTACSPQPPACRLPFPACPHPLPLPVPRLPACLPCMPIHLLPAHTMPPTLLYIPCVFVVSLTQLHATCADATLFNWRVVAVVAICDVDSGSLQRCCDKCRMA